MPLFERNFGGRDWRLNLGPVTFSRLQAGRPKITQLTLGSLWITYGTDMLTPGKPARLTVNWGGTLVIDGPFMVRRA